MYLAVIGVICDMRSMVFACIRYDLTDQTLVNERVAQFRDQTRRFLAGALSEDEFRHLRLRNGLYIQRHAMLRSCNPVRTAFIDAAAQVGVDRAPL